MSGRLPQIDDIQKRRKASTARRFFRLARFHRFVTLVGSGVALVMLTLCLLALYEGRQEALQRARETSQNLLLILQKDISRNVELYDLSLQSALEGSQRSDVMSLPASMQREVLFDRSVQARYLGALLVLDAQGNVLIDSINPIPRQGNFSDREYFTVHRDNPNVGLYLSDPFRSRLSHGRWTMVLSRRISRPDGSFGGVALVAIGIDYFHDLLAGLDIGPHGVLLLAREDGVMISRQPDHTNVGHSLLGSPNFKRFQSAASGTFTGVDRLEGIRRLYSYARIPGVPVIAVVAPAEEDILKNWRERSILIGGLMAIFSAVFIGVSSLLAHELRERARTQQALIEQATHDKLTGVSNRHALDATLSREWRRAKRDGRTLGILFIDVDAFKSYNDHYGHAAGDEALAAVAQSISKALRRPADSVGRYGGEEFVVALPDTHIDGAMQVAEQIRDSIAQRGLVHAYHSHGAVTVSIGVALSDEPDVGSLAELVEKADKALYRAKAEGRNVVRAAA
jgi:diguanylate cyclase (GGDEF)-like protein